MAGVVFAVAFSVTCLRGLLVFDHVNSSDKLVARATQMVSSIGPKGASRRHLVTPPVTSPRQHAAASAGSTRVRILHRWLLATHFAAGINGIAGCVEYLLPAVTDISCGITSRAGIASHLAYDASLVLVLLAKASVTNGNRTLAWWERCITWWSRFFAWFYLPAVAISVICLLPFAANEDGTLCLAGSKTASDGDFSDTVGYIISNGALIIQFVLLLSIFIKPMLLPQGGTQSGGAVYRRVVNRNTLCTVSIVFSYMVTTLVVVLSHLDTSPKAAHINDSMPVINMVLTLCLTEMALPLGFSSCYKSIAATRNLTTGQSNAQQNLRQLYPRRERPVGVKPQAAGLLLAGTSSTATKHQPTGAAVVVPVEGDVL